MGEVYCIHNAVNGKRYIGKTISTACKRWKAHVKQARSLLGNYIHSAIRKYGAYSFRIEVLASAMADEDLCSLERMFIETWHTDQAKNGYNLTNGGERGFTANAEMRAKISAAAKRRQHSTERRASIGAASRANWADPEYRKKMIAARTGKKRSPEARTKMAAMLAEIQSRPEVREKQLAAWSRPEYRTRALAGLLCPETQVKKKVALSSPETRAKMSASAKALAKTPERLAQCSAANKGRVLPPEWRANIAAGSKRRWDGYTPEERRKRVYGSGRPALGGKVTLGGKIQVH